MFIEKDAKSSHTHYLSQLCVNYVLIMCNIYLLFFTGNLDLRKKFNVAFWLCFQQDNCNIKYLAKALGNRLQFECFNFFHAKFLIS